MTAEEQAKPAHSVEPPALGTTLRKAREAVGLSADDLARSLHLNLSVIQALDADDYAKLPPPTFVHGYLRHYASAVGLSADDLIAAYRVRSGEQAQKITPEFTHPVQARSNDSSVKAASWFIGLIMVMLVIAWWQSPNIHSDTDNALTLAAGDPLVSLTVQALPIPQIDGPVIPGGMAPETLPDAESAAESSAPEPSISDSSRPSDHLRLTMTADSWIEITNADGQRVFYGMGKQGQEIELEVAPPISLLFGHAPGVEVEYNGEAFDHKPHTQAGVARFELGPVAE